MMMDTFGRVIVINGPLTVAKVQKVLVYYDARIRELEGSSDVAWVEATEQPPPAKKKRARASK